MTDTPRDPLDLYLEGRTDIPFTTRKSIRALHRQALDATRPSGDEALREAVQYLPEMVGEPNPEGWSLVRRKDVLALLGEPR